MYKRKSKIPDQIPIYKTFIQSRRFHCKESGPNDHANLKYIKIALILECYFDVHQDGMVNRSTFSQITFLIVEIH